MSEAMFGADVEELDRLGRNLQAASQRLAEIGVMMRGLPRHAWRGPDAERFFADLDQVLLPTLTATANGVEAAGQVAATNAAHQREASGAESGQADVTGTGPGGGGTGGAPAGSDSGGRTSRGPDTVGKFLTLAEDFAGKSLGILELVGKSPADEAFFGGLGVITGAVGLGQSVAEGEWTQATVDALHVGTALLPGGAGILADVGLDLFEMFVPLTDERQNAMLEYWARNEFGLSVSELNPEQSGQLGRRYDGPKGLLNMFHDSVLESANNPDSLVGATIGATGNAIADVGYGAYEKVTSWWKGK